MEAEAIGSRSINAWFGALVLVLAAGATAGNRAGSPGDTAPALLAGEREKQFEELRRQLGRRGRGGLVARLRAEAFREAACCLESDRDPADVVLRRTSALLADLKALDAAGALSGAEAALRKLRRKGRSVPVEDANGRRRLYESACRLRRRIAFANPLLDFGKVLFVKRHRSRYNHMCDQFYGFNARRGGGLFVLHDPFGPRPTVRNVLAGSTVGTGRLAGRKLTPGAFLSPDLSCDGKEVLFAYTELGQGARWSPEKSFHVFKVNVDGSSLVQLTDGKWNDFDPCWLPRGGAGRRIAFISERRGGFLRCGRYCPTYTLHAMHADGSGLARLSFHETHEWQPSVAHDGRIVYTRWDYVDRDTNVAHHLWLTTPDGRDPRSPHGNYPLRRRGRPWMEMDLRAVPGSRRFVATAAGHHGQAYGSLVLIDLDVPDDGAMSQLRRLTPDVRFPEGEGGREAYGTAWPLSEDYCLCVYDPAGSHYGIYLLDSFGNKELLYRDPGIASISPIPLRPRAEPAVMPTRTQAPGGRDDAGAGTLAVINVYESLLPWPEATHLAGLRIIQLLPKSTAPPNRPRIGIASQSNARAVLGTVPVEPDGSAHFRAPAGRPIYFQALDRRGLAVQSMRSVTYLQPGERLVCRGCHEPKTTAPSMPKAVPLALRRGPSEIRPEAPGANPFSYPRLVQPVLDRHCVSCHAGNPRAPKLGSKTGRNGWHESYRGLGRYAFYYHSVRGCFGRGGSRTVPGRFGARASKLLAILAKGHHGVKLPADDLHRITLWLDCNSEFYGAYEDTAAQSAGAVVRPSLE